MRKTCRNGPVALKVDTFPETGPASSGKAVPGTSHMISAQTKHVGLTHVAHNSTGGVEKVPIMLLTFTFPKE